MGTWLYPNTKIRVACFPNQNRLRERKETMLGLFTETIHHCQRCLYLDHKKLPFLSSIFDPVNVIYTNLLYFKNEKKREKHQ